MSPPPPPELPRHPSPSVPRRVSTTAGGTHGRLLGRTLATTLGHMGDSKTQGAAVIRRRRLR
eukprot:9496142-Pyramimonas_sp.AAC.1